MYKSTRRTKEMLEQILLDDDDDTENEVTVNSDSDQEPPSKKENPGKPTRTRRGLASLLQEKSETIEPIVNEETQVYTTQIKSLLQKCNDLRKAPVKLEDEEKEIISSSGKPLKKTQLPTRITRNSLTKIEDITNKESPSIPPPSPSCTIVKPRKRPKGLKKLLKKVQHQKNDCLKSYYASVAVKETSCGLEDDDDDVICTADDDDSDREIMVKFAWCAKVIRIPMRKKQSFYTVLSKVSESFDIPESNLLLSLKDTVIDPEDTPSAISLDVCDIIDCGTISTSTEATETVPSEVSDPATLKLKLQTVDRKKNIELGIKKHTPIILLKRKYAAQMAVDVEKLVFKFDGDVLNDDDTPEDLELEDGYCIDVLVNS